MKKGSYLYCIIGEVKKKDFGPIGINGREVELINYKDINAVVSETPLINFDRFDKEKITYYVSIHQKVNEEVLQDYDLVPMTFGIIAHNPGEISTILEKAYFQFKSTLKKITGKAEFVVQVSWDPKKLLVELAATSPEIQKFQEELSSKAGILSLATKLRLGKLIQQKAEILRGLYLKEIENSLQSLTQDFTSNKLIKDEMIANFSFLIDKAKESELDRIMQELGKKYQELLRFKYIGPMPAYSFVNINLSLDNFELIDEAKTLLGLGEYATFQEIKKVYYSLAHQYHPDKQDKQDNLERTQEEMKKITQAYQVLESYCQSCDESMKKAEGGQYSFNEEEVKKTILIK